MALTYTDAETCLGNPRVYEEMFGPTPPARTYADFATPCVVATAPHPPGGHGLRGRHGERVEPPSVWYVATHPLDLQLGTSTARYSLVLNLTSHMAPVVAIPLPATITYWNDDTDLADLIRLLTDTEGT